MFSHFLSFRVIALLFGLSFPILTYAKIEVNELVTHLPKGVSVGFIAKNLNTNHVIAEYQSEQFMLPASTQKVFTALAAKLVLPENFRFQTALLTNGEVENGTVKKDLIVRFTGDPELTQAQLMGLFNQLQQQGIRRIEGDLILDTSVFTGQDKALGWVWNDLPICFSAPAAAANINNNCFYVNLEANQPAGSLIKVNVPSAYPVQVFSSAYVADKEESRYCQLDTVFSDNNRYQIKGCLARQEKPFGLSFAIQDPTLYASNVLKAQLERANIQFNGHIQIASKPVSARLLAEHFSPPVEKLIHKMMKKSDNQIADVLFRTIANQRHQRSASFALASHTMQGILKTQAKIDVGNSVMADGSGLSRYNQVSATTMLQALEFIAKNEDSLQLFETFPKAGVDGTLSGRGSMIYAPLVNNVTAKTGALKGVYNLAGFMNNARGEKIAFVQFINGYSTSSNPEQKTKRGSLNQFEHKLYLALFND